MNVSDFERDFHLLTDTPPFPWQRRLYERFVMDRPDNIPQSCSLPTGLGKTSVIAIWLIALAHHHGKMPRRLVYVVNRRTVVDQTTNEVEKLRKDLPKLKTWFPELAISTLRGQFADNREWSADPSRPAVICGTVDMIGSRLLFSGYGVGFKSKPLHAGFLGQDALLVHDEAHLEPAFQRLITDIEAEHKRCNEFAKFRVMELSATSRGGGEVFQLDDDDRANLVVRQRIDAKKTIHLIENKDEKKLAEEIADLALRFDQSSRAVLIFLRKVDDVEKVVKKLPKGRFEQLTGTLRGKERDELVEKPIFKRFLPKAAAGETTVYLVCTSAGEVGVNISADHLVCDLSTFDSMAQRFGRVNRFGERDDTEIHIVHPKKCDEEDDNELRLKKTLDLLQKLQGNGSPAALERLDPTDRAAAFAPPPIILPTSDILFDSWALTTIRGKLPGRPIVEPYLHGISAWEPPETHVAWREEVAVIVGDLPATHEPEGLLDDYPLKPHELLRDNTKRVFDRLVKLNAPPETPIWIVSDDDSVEVTTLGALVAAGKDTLNHKTVLLPPSAGGLENGMLTSSSKTANDVSDDWRDEKGNQRRVRIWDDDPIPVDKSLIRLIRTIDTRPDSEEGEEESTRPRYWRWYELRKGGDSDGSKSSNLPVLWQVHTDDVTLNAERIVANLPLQDEIKNAIVVAAKLHDLGKRRKLFQRILGNADPNKLLAKSGAKGGRVQEQFRHEFGSLVDAHTDSSFKELDCDLKDLILHLIAAHHGRARPHFPLEEAFDPEPEGADVLAIAAEVPRRFARLQREFGRWGLAYLESLLRAADYAASASPSSTEGQP